MKDTASGPLQRVPTLGNRRQATLELLVFAPRSLSHSLTEFISAVAVFTWQRGGQPCVRPRPPRRIIVCFLLRPGQRLSMAHANSYRHRLQVKSCPVWLLNLLSCQPASQSGTLALSPGRQTGGRAYVLLSSPAASTKKASVLYSLLRLHLALHKRFAGGSPPSWKTAQANSPVSRSFHLRYDLTRDSGKREV